MLTVFIFTVLYLSLCLLYLILLCCQFNVDKQRVDFNIIFNGNIAVFQSFSFLKYSLMDKLLISLVENSWVIRDTNKLCDGLS